MKKTDGFLLALALVTLFLAGYAFIQSRPGTTAPVLVPQSELQLIGIIRESDCLDCIEKLICGWDLLQEVFPEDGSVRLYLGRLPNSGLSHAELSLLCPLPDALVLKEMDSLEQSDKMPLATPALMIIQNGLVLYQEPIFTSTDMVALQARLNRIITDYLARAQLTR